MSTPATLPPGRTLRANFRNLYYDVAWYGVLAGSTVAFLAVYAAHLGATGFQVALLTAGPGAVNLLFSLPSGRWLEGSPLIRMTFLSSVWTRLAYVALIPLPFLFGSAGEIRAIVVLSVLMSVPGTLLAIAFNAMFADIVPPDWRGSVVGRRNAILAISLTVTSLLCAWLLETLRFPLNYQVVFALGAVGAAMSSFHLGRLRPWGEPQPRVGRPMPEAARPGLLRFADALRTGSGLRFLTRSEGGKLVRLDLLRGPFGPFLGAYLFFYTVQYIPIPLLPLFIVRELHLSDGAISLGNALFYVTMTLASLWLGRMSARYGHRGVLVLSGLSYGLYPLLVGLARDASLYWVASGVGGAVWGLLNGGLLNRLLERVPEGDRPAHMALHNLGLNLGILAGSLLGPVIAGGLGLKSSLLLAAGLRLLSGVLLLFLG